MTYIHHSHCLSNVHTPPRCSQSMAFFGLFFSWVARPQRISIPNYSYLECPITFSKSIEYQMITQSSILSSQVKTRMLCQSILSTWPSLRLTAVSPGLVHDTCIRESYTSLLNLGRTYFNFLPIKKLITRLPLN